MRTPFLPSQAQAPSYPSLGDGGVFASGLSLIQVPSGRSARSTPVLAADRSPEAIPAKSTMQVDMDSRKLSEHLIIFPQNEQLDIDLRYSTGAAGCMECRSSSSRR